MVKRDLLRHIGVLLLVILGLVALRIWVFTPVTINEQMANHYLAEDDLVLAMRNKELNYGDFVLYTEDGEDYVGRIIAKEGDSVTYLYDVLYRNDEIVSEDYLLNKGATEYFTEDMTIATLTDNAHERVAENHYLILNDNRADKRDSRTFGFIKAENIVGPLTFRIRPFNQFGFIDNGLAQ